MTEYFTLKSASELNPEALQCFYRVYPDRARTLPVFVAARLRPFESGDDSSNIFTFNDTSNWDVDDVDFTVGGADPQEFYQSDAWAGFDSFNDTGRSCEEMS